MTRSESKDDFALVYDALMPVFSQAAIGNFDNDLELREDYPRRVKELLMGVNVLLDVIREKADEEPAGTPAPAPRIGLLDEVLKRPL